MLIGVTIVHVLIETAIIILAYGYWCVGPLNAGSVPVDASSSMAEKREVVPGLMALFTCTGRYA